MTTNEIAERLGVGYVQIYNLIRYRKITPPAKTRMGYYWWTEAELEAARQ